MSSLLHDLRHALRALARDAKLTGSVVVTLALGICASSTVFSWIDGSLLTPIPGATGTSRLLAIGKGPRNDSPTPPFSYLDLQDLRRSTSSFSGLLAYHDDWVSLTGSGRPERAYAALVSANYFDLLGVRPALGRTFLPGEEGVPGGAPFVVLGHALWQSRFAGSPSVIGRTIEINRTRLTVIGVAPEGFQGCKTGLRADLYIPLSMDAQVWGSSRMNERETDWLNVVGRLRDAVDARQAEGEINARMAAVAAQYPTSHQGPINLWLDPLWRSGFGANVFLYRGLPLLLALALAVLVLACANVANLLLVRAIGRQRETAVKVAMGAGRGRLVQQMLAESVLLALGGGLLAALLTGWTSDSLRSLLPPTTHPLSLNGRIDGTVLAATLLFSLLAAVGAGLLPAWRASRVRPVEVLHQDATRGSTGRGHVARGLVVLQVALSLLLLVTAGLFTRSLQNAQQTDPGFRASGVVLAAVDVTPAGFDRKREAEFEHRLLQSLRAIPGVQQVALSDWVPLTLNKRTTWTQFEGYVPQLHESLETRVAIVSPGYFETLGIPVLAGRDFDDHDTLGSQPVAIVSQELASRYWPGQDAVGKRLTTWGDTFTVIGVARDFRHQHVNEQPEPMLFLACLQGRSYSPIVHVRTASATTVLPAIDRAVHAINADLPLFQVTTLSEAIKISGSMSRVMGLFSGAFGLLAVALAAVGIYGVVSYTTRQRTREIGIRMALGATRARVFRMVIKEGLVLTAWGLALGTAAAVASTRVLRGLLVGVDASDPMTLLTVFALLAAVASAACAVPAARAATAQPMRALRHD